MEVRGPTHASAVLPSPRPGDRLPSPIERWLGGPQSYTAHLAEDNILLPLLVYETQFLGCPPSDLSSPAKRTKFLQGNLLAIIRLEERDKTYRGYIYTEENFLFLLGQKLDAFQGHFECNFNWEATALLQSVERRGPS